MVLGFRLLFFAETCAHTGMKATQNWYPKKFLPVLSHIVKIISTPTLTLRWHSLKNICFRSLDGELVSSDVFFLKAVEEYL